jgi:hypothetical protein
MIGKARNDVMKRILLLAGLVLFGVGAAGCYDVPEAGWLNPEVKYRCTCGATKFAAEDATPPTCCNTPMTRLDRAISKP